ncbi:uncharacterized protein LOC123270169 [Cotesia glomerata]|uniref:uncharacterized protein LOC123270169 n=1 Tax=Cotesia glomerata TaxID=32391 RepID=UPI001D027B83|nr:uncharacterized protein LOC123270169 [Cotesia glomerata]
MIEPISVRTKLWHPIGRILTVNCLQKYKNHHIDENHYCYPLLEDGVTIIRRALLENGREGLIKDKISSPNKENNKTSGNFQIPNSKNKKVKTKAQFSVSPNKRLNDTEVELLTRQHSRYKHFAHARFKTMKNFFFSNGKGR